MAVSAPEQPLRKTDRTRLRLLEAVRQEVEAAGSFTADGVARRAGSSAATFYNHFASKDEALVAAFAATMDDLVVFVRDRLQIERLLEVGLRRFASDWVLGAADFFRRNRMTFGAAQMQFPASDALREIYRSREDDAFAAFVRFVQLGQRARVLRAGDAEAIAHGMMVTAEGWNNPAVLRMEAGDALHAELARTVVRMLEPEGSGAQGGGA